MNKLNCRSIMRIKDKEITKFCDSFLELASLVVDPSNTENKNFISGELVWIADCVTCPECKSIIPNELGACPICKK
jgi:hypothetical protein